MTTATKSEDARSTEVFEQMKTALLDPNVAIKFTQTFSHGRAVQVYVKTRKIGPFILPPDDGRVSDVLRMLADLLDD